MMEPIPKIQFFKSNKKKIEFEIMKLSYLFSREEKLSVPLHVPQRLQFFNVMFVSKGSGVHFIDFKPHPFNEGDLVFVSKGQAQAFKASPNHDGFLMLFTERFFSKNLAGADATSFYRLYNYHLQSPIVRPAMKDVPMFKNLIKNIFDEYANEDEFAQEEILSLMLRLVLLKAERQKRTDTAQTNSSEALLQFQNFQTFLEENVSKTRNAKDYAQMMHISYKHLNEICKAVTGNTAKEVIDNFLTLEIKRNLAVSEISVKELAYNLGFDEPTNFVKYFKKQTSQTPTQFRHSLAN